MANTHSANIVGACTVPIILVLIFSSTNRNLLLTEYVSQKDDSM